MVESDTARVSDLLMVESDTARVSVLVVPAVFLGKVALDVVGLGVGPPCLRVDSEETLLTLMDERAHLVRVAPGVTLEDGSEEGAPVLELIEHSVLGKPLGKPLVDSLQEPMPVMKRMEQAILATASVWEPLEHLHCVVSDNVDFFLDGALGRRRDARRWLLALCDFLEDSELVGESAVQPSGDCRWTWVEVDQEP